MVNVVLWRPNVVVGSQIACDLLSSSPTVSVRLQQSQEYFAALSLRVRRSCAISVPHLHVPGIEYRERRVEQIGETAAARANMVVFVDG